MYRYKNDFAGWDQEGERTYNIILSDIFKGFSNILLIDERLSELIEPSECLIHAWSGYDSDAGFGFSGAGLSIE
jgi:hypothetical protein